MYGHGNRMKEYYKNIPKAKLMRKLWMEVWKNMKESNYIKYSKPYPTIGELIKDNDYDYVSYRIDYPGCDEEPIWTKWTVQKRAIKSYLELPKPKVNIDYSYEEGGF